MTQMANVALFTDMPNKTINNTEGAMLLQLLFQVMTGSEALNQIMVELLEEFFTWAYKIYQIFT